MSNATEKSIARIIAAAERDAYARVRSYSGRGMYGRECIAVRTDWPEDLIADAGVAGARTDSMGRSSIVYWPAIACPAGVLS